MQRVVVAIAEAKQRFLSSVEFQKLNKVAFNLGIEIGCVIDRTNVRDNADSSMLVVIIQLIKVRHVECDFA